MTSPSDEVIEWSVEVQVEDDPEWFYFYGWFEDETRADECLRRALSEVSTWSNARKVKRTSRVEVVE
jgi:hypothetical protein